MSLQMPTFSKKKDEVNADLYCIKAKALIQAQKFEEAQQLLQQALKAIPSNSSIMSKLEEVNAEIRKKQLANFTPAQLAKEDGNRHYKESRYDKAIECYTNALNLTKDPLEMATYYNNRAACYQQLQMYTEVVTDCNLCLDITANNGKALIRRGLAFECRENWKMARLDFERALSVEPNAKQASDGLLRVTKNLKAMENLK